MPIAQNISKNVVYKKEGIFGVIPTDSGAKSLRRVSSSFNLSKETYGSNEIRKSKQKVSNKHGVRSATGNVSGELSAGTYSEFMASVVGRDFDDIIINSEIDTTVEVLENTYKFVREDGSWITDGYRPGIVIRATGLTALIDNNRNFLITSISELEMTFIPLNGIAPTAQETPSLVVFNAPGQSTHVPVIYHTEDSYSFEQHYSNINQSEVFSGCKVTEMKVGVPISGMTTVDFSFVGKDLSHKTTSSYFTNPAPKSSCGIFAAVNGALVVNGSAVALITSMDFTITRNTENAVVVGSDSIADIISGRISVTGTLSVYFINSTFRDYFNKETSISLILSLSDSRRGDSDFITFVIPKIKINSFSINNNDMGVSASCSFQALLNTDTTNGFQNTTIAIQDSMASFESKLLQENGNAILLEDGDYILLEYV